MDQEDTKRLEIYLGTIAKWKTRVKDEILSVLPVSENDKITNMNTEQQCEVEDSEAVKLLKKFTIKILFAKTNSQELSLLLNDRSDLLFRLSMFQSCVDDISRINLDFFPSSVQQEIFRRQAKSHIALTIQSLSTLVDNPMMFNEEDDNLIQDLVYNFESISGISFNAGNECLFEPTIPIFPEKNEFIPGFSDAVKLNYSDELGRFLTATRDLLPGELIGACKTYVSVVSRDDRHNFCWFCKKQTYNGIACEACPLVLYCSVDCLNESHEQYHSIECAILPLLLIDDDYIVLTMALRTTIKAYKECECDIDKLMSTYDVNAKSPTKVELLKSDHDPNKYGSVDKAQNERKQ
ncbi:SET and MYND domain-containing protein 4-like [Aphidius gifuensis]|uniref:SET and MYND domain-containing protein 4-like n=1 Tax=Aphidius gifuensis TaxID=684658 RepID=UPI001CDCDE9D|nr:SET and MYND domain-containing protein 4-like [Aphidius gifuensis]